MDCLQSIFPLYYHYIPQDYVYDITIYYHYITIYYTHYYITIILPICIWGYPKLWYPKTALTPRFREPFAPFHVPAESGHGIMIRFSCANSPQRFAGGLYLKTLLIEDPFSKLL